MSLNTLAEYRKLFRNRHGVACPLTDANIRTAMATANVKEDAWPLVPGVLTEMEALVASAYPNMELSAWQMTGTFIAMSNLVVDNLTATTVDLNFSLPTGGNPPYSIQLQQAPDVADAPGTYANAGSPQATNAEIVVTGLTTLTKYWWRLICTDHLGETGTSNAVTATTTA